jgi:hypothetical protein
MMNDKWRTVSFYEACKFMQGKTPKGVWPVIPHEECVEFTDGCKVWCMNSEFDVFPEKPRNRHGWDIEVDNPKFSIFDPNFEGSE